MNGDALQRRVLELLESFRGIEPLRRLFWSELNYEQREDPLSRRGWPETISGALAEDPVIFASGGADDGFEVIYCRLIDRLLLEPERRVIEKLYGEGHDRALFVFSNSNRDRWHFVNTRFSSDEGRRRLYRRITVGPEEEHRTASERISMLDLDGMDGAYALDILARHDEAFNVEPVTDEFFREYARVFARVEQLVEGIAEPERKRLFTQRLFNRLMFLAFIQKKGWLSFGGRKDYLAALWEAYRRDEYDENFYRDRLKHLFFAGLNNPHEVDIIGINEGGYLRDVIGDVPYLNGGLFERDEEDRDEAIVVPDEAISVILNELFIRFNFTVTESTPLDVEVAVDPEMLGRVFEELVTGRHETGSYYTPNPSSPSRAGRRSRGTSERSCRTTRPGPCGGSWRSRIQRTCATRRRRWKRCEARGSATRRVEAGRICSECCTNSWTCGRASSPPAASTPSPPTTGSWRSSRGTSTAWT